MLKNDSETGNAEWKISTLDTGVSERIADLFHTRVEGAEEWRSALEVPTGTDSVPVVFDDHENIGRRLVLRDRRPGLEGPRSGAEVTFRLAADPDVGVFVYRSYAWGFVRSTHDARMRAQQSRGPVPADLSLRKNRYSLRSGPMAERTVALWEPTIESAEIEIS